MNDLFSRLANQTARQAGRASVDARNSMMNLEDATEEQIAVVKAEIQGHCDDATSARSAAEVELAT